jgi:hypothetical protein
MTSVAKAGSFDLNDILEGGAVLLVFTPSVYDDDYARQKDVLDEQASALADLGVELIEVLGEDLAACACGTIVPAAARSLRQRFAPEVDRFAMVLVCRDGEIDFKEHKAIDAHRLLEMLHNSCAVAHEVHPEYAGQA